MKFIVTATKKKIKLLRRFTSGWDMHVFIEDWGNQGVKHFEVKVIKEYKKRLKSSLEGKGGRK